MNRILTLGRLANGNGGNRSHQRDRTLSMRAVQEANDDLDTTLARVGGSFDGLLEADAVERLAEFGPNEVAQEKAPHWFLQLLSCFRNPFIIVLVAIASIQYLTSPHDPRSIIIIGAMVAIAVGLQFWQEYRSTRAAEALKALVCTTATVLRRERKGAQADPREIRSRSSSLAISCECRPVIWFRLMCGWSPRAIFS
jgi:P-type Mg2+ transporter